MFFSIIIINSNRHYYKDNKFNTECFKSQNTSCLPVHSTVYHHDSAKVFLMVSPANHLHPS